MGQSRKTRHVNIPRGRRRSGPPRAERTASPRPHHDTPRGRRRSGPPRAERAASPRPHHDTPPRAPPKRDSPPRRIKRCQAKLKTRTPGPSGARGAPPFRNGPRGREKSRNPQGSGRGLQRGSGAEAGPQKVRRPLQKCPALRQAEWGETQRTRRGPPRGRRRDERRKRQGMPTVKSPRGRIPKNPPCEHPPRRIRRCQART